MVETSLNTEWMMRNTAHTQVHQQHRIQLTPQSSLVLGQGELFRHVNPDNFMWTDAGDRHLNVFVPFAKTMTRVPVVQVNLIGVDAAHTQNLRLKLTVANTGTDGFIVTAHTWQDTKLAGVDVSWMAIEYSALQDKLALVPTPNGQPLS
jgi:hypothetical protein